MKFSVIIPVYNAQKYICESVESVLSQTYKDFEIVLVNDGSTDESGAICDSLREEYGSVIKVVHQENRGQLLSRCVGAELAHGDYCVYLDADDLLYKSCLSKLKNTIQLFSEPDMVIYNYDRLTMSGEKNCSRIPLKSNFIYEDEQKRVIYDILMSGSELNSIWNKCIKREHLTGCVEKFTKYESLRCGEDRLQVMKAVTRAKSIVFIEDALLCYRLFDGSVTRNFDISQVSKFNMKILCETEEDYLEKWGLNISEWRKRLEAFFLNNAMYTFCKFYENVSDTNQRKMLIRYDWTDFVPEAYLKGLDKNPNVSDVYKTLWQYVINKDYLKIKVFFIKKSIYKKLRDMKRKTFK